MHISAIILAAGYSSRMGELKALLPIGNQTLLARVVGLFRTAGISDLLVVTGYQTQRITAELLDLGVPTVYNPLFPEGMFSSVQTGVAGLNPKTEAFFLLPVDIPLLQVQTLHEMIKAFKATGPRVIVHPCFQGRRGHPPLIGQCYTEALLQWTGEDGLRGFFRQCAVEQVQIEVDDEYILYDLDTPEKYRHLIEQFNRRSLLSRT